MEDKSFGFQLAAALVTMVVAAMVIPVIAVILMMAHVLVGCLVGHAADLMFGNTIRPALNQMFGWPLDLHLSYVGATLGFLYSWFSPLAIVNSITGKFKK